MKTSPHTNNRPAELVIPLPEPRLLRLIARSILLFLLLLSLPWLRSALPSDSTNDELFYMPKLLHDMKSHGLINPQGRSLFLGNPGPHAPLLRLHGIPCLPERNIPQLAASPHSLDFIFLVAAPFTDAYFRSLNPALRVGGIAAFKLGNTHPVKPFNLPANYRMIYIQNIGRTVVAVKKLYHDNPGRRILSASVEALEDGLLEPPVEKKHWERVRYLPELIGESLDVYPRRVFVDIGSPGRIGAEDWFRNMYPRNEGFEMVRVDLVDFPAASGRRDVGEWLRGNVRKEEYVVVKAEVEAVEEMGKGEVFELVDELFMECRIDWGIGDVEEEGKWRKRAYWECLALFGKLRKSGVAVHQWWG